MVGRILRVVFLVLLVLTGTPILLSALYAALPPPSVLMIGRWLAGARVERRWVPIEEMPVALVATTIASEDARFCKHRGVDWDELIEVIEDEDGPARGASTISMQVAKNLFLWNSRSRIRKAIEIPLAIYLDFVWSKRRMMEIYLNIAEWGPDGEFGVEAGALRAFKKQAKNLSPREAALMVSVLPNPIRRDPARPSAVVARKAGIVGARARDADLSCLGLARR